MIQSQVNQQMVEPQPMMQQPMPYIPQQYNPNYGPYPTADLQPPGYYPPMPYNMHPHYALPGYQNQPSHVFPVSQLNQFPYNEMQGVMPANVPEPVGTNNPPVNVKNPPAQNEFENPTTTETTTDKIGNQPSQIEHPAPLVSPPTYDLAALENLPNVPKNDIEVKEKEPASQDAEGLLISFE